MRLRSNNSCVESHTKFSAVPVISSGHQSFHLGIKGAASLHTMRGHCSGMLNVQAYVSRARAESFSLTADMMYVSQNAPRICRALFEICLRRSWSTAADMALTMCKVGAVRPLAAAGPTLVMKSSMVLQWSVAISLHDQ